jgi:hypothetical protein
MKKERSKYKLCKIFGYMRGRQAGHRSDNRLDPLVEIVRQKLIAFDAITVHDEWRGYDYEEEGLTGFF